MAAFRDDPSEWERLDWRLLQNSPIALYWREAVLAEDRAWLAAHGYRVYRLDAGAWGSVAGFHRDARRVLEFPTYYGENLAAFNDCLSDLSVPAEGGAALELRRFDAFARRDPHAAHAILDIIAENARRLLLRGRRLLALVQSEDPRLGFEPVGAVGAVWNPREWLDSSRGLDTAT